MSRLGEESTPHPPAERRLRQARAAGGRAGVSPGLGRAGSSRLSISLTLALGQASKQSKQASNPLAKSWVEPGAVQNFARNSRPAELLRAKRAVANGAGGAIVRAFGAWKWLRVGGCVGIGGNPTKGLQASKGSVGSKG